MKLSEEIIQFLLRHVEAFHAQSPLSDTHAALYARVPSEALIRAFLESFERPDRIEQAAETLAEQMYQADIPYVVIMGVLNALKEGLLAYYKEKVEDAFALIAKTENLFERAKNEMARVYLLDQVRRNGVIPHTKLKDKALIALYEAWFSKFQQAVLEGDKEAFKRASRLHAEFEEVLFYPESIIVCLDVNACDEVHRMHQNIARQARLFYLKWLSGEHMHAYILYNELQVSVKQLVALLVTLYYNYETDRLGAFLKFLEGATALHDQVYLGVLNVKNLAKINRLQGESAGDHILNVTEQQLQKAAGLLKEYFVYIRGIEGDFYILTVGLDAHDVRTVLDGILRDVEAAVREDVPGEPLQASAIRINYLQSMHTEIIRRLLVILHQTKARLTLWETQQAVAEVEKQISAALQETINIRQFLEDKAVEIHLQPIARLRPAEGEHRFLAFEVLGRIRTAQGLLSAGLFIDALVEMNLTDRFDSLMLEAVCEKADVLEEITDTLFLNVSPASLNNEAYVTQLEAALRGPLQRLSVVLELTEQTMLEKQSLVTRLAREKGLVFAIDDFGTGYSSLMTVIDLATQGVIKYLKVDGTVTRSITEKTETAYVFEIISDMATSLKLYSIAEFIENEAIAKALSEREITYGQGYYLGKPNSPDYWLIECSMAAC